MSPGVEVMHARSLAALAAGFLFGLGLAISRMIDPAKVQGFLDLAGKWDPSLAFVMIGAIAVSLAGFRLAARRPKPVLEPSFQLPAKTTLDLPLIAGALIFGIGWGLVGYCPGPALASLLLGRWETVLFVVAMIAGMLLHRGYDRATTANRSGAATATAD
jgi:uncharacterized membrane protein YedE/YeeE